VITPVRSAQTMVPSMCGSKLAGRGLRLQVKRGQVAKGILDGLVE